MTMKLKTSPTASKTASVRRHQRELLQVAPMPANSAASGRTGTKNRSMRCVNSHQTANTKTK